MLFGGGVFGLLAFALWVYCILDVIATDDSVVQHLPKVGWLVIVIIVPIVGSVAWLVLGRPRTLSLRPGDTSYRAGSFPPPAEPTGFPEMVVDHEEYQRRRDEALRRHQAERDEAEQKRQAELEALRLQAWEDELKRREEELRRREDGPASPAS